VRSLTANCGILQGMGWHMRVASPNARHFELKVQVSKLKLAISRGKLRRQMQALYRVVNVAYRECPKNQICARHIARLTWQHAAAQ